MSRLFSALVVALMTLVPAAHAAESAEEFYKGKTITYIVATAPGGGYDAYGRLVARFMQKQMPGTKIIVKNLPGAGHVVGANTIYAAKPDGLTIGTFNTGLIYLQLLKDPGIRFDLDKFSWVGKAARDVRVLILSKKAGIPKLDDLFDRTRPKAKLFAAGVGSAAYADTKLVIDAVQMNVEVIPGYNGSEGTRSMLRGETQGTIGSQSSYADFVASGNGYYAMEIGGPPDSKFPQAEAFAHDDRARAMLKMIAAQADVARLTAGPPGISPDRLAYLRQVYVKALADPELQADAKKMDIPIDPADGPHVQDVMGEALRQTPENIALLAAAVNMGKKP